MQKKHIAQEELRESKKQAALQKNLVVKIKRI